MTKTSGKVLALIIRLSSLLLMVCLTGCASDRDPQRTDYRIDDNRMAERVREALAAGADYRYDGVKVIARDGVAQLSGSVNTRVQKGAAGEVASKVVGVNSVVNDIKVEE
jgi:osmotically-inducible protein OsmY